MKLWLNSFLLPHRLLEAVVKRCSVKKVFLEIFQNSQGNTCARDSFLINLQALACNFSKKESLALVFPCEFCEISKNTLSYRTSLWLLLVFNLPENVKKNIFYRNTNIFYLAENLNCFIWSQVIKNA